MKIDIKKYTPEDKPEWNNFISQTYNATFLHNRNYMDYHQERFQDSSLMLYKNGRLTALLPAHIKDNELFSHNGLTYGDLLMSKKAKTGLKMELLEALLNYLNEKGITSWNIKAIPSFFHQVSDESLAYLYSQKGAIIEKNLAFFLVDKANYHLNKNRQRNIRKATEGNDLRISYEKDNLKEYWHIVEENLRLNHQSKPVHNFSEMQYLMKQFPENIQLATIFNEKKMLGGVILYQINGCLHFQYINSIVDESARNSIDYLVNEIIKKNIDKYTAISFGTAENKDRQINKELVY